MSTLVEVAVKPQRRWIVWTGRVLTAIPILTLAMSAVFSLAHTPTAVAGMKQLGYDESKVIVVGVLALGSALLYAIQRTAVLGAILMTAYFGGAVAAHVRISDPGYPMAILMGILVWLGLYLRDERLRVLVPFRRFAVTPFRPGYRG